MSREFMPRGKVPTPEEIKALLDSKGGGNILFQQIESLDQQVANLRGEVKAAARGMTPQQRREALELLFVEHGVDPFVELIRMTKARIEDKLRAEILMELAQYVMPKMKSIEVSGTVNHAHTIHIVRYGEDGRVTREPAALLPAAKPVVEVGP